MVLEYISYFLGLTRGREGSMFMSYRFGGKKTTTIFLRRQRREEKCGTEDEVGGTAVVLDCMGACVAITQV